MNGGGSNTESRKAASQKFESDLSSALREKPELKGFIFFTNVDLTPHQKAELKEIAIRSGMDHVEVFDFEVLRHILDTPQGLIPRLQYLDIPMSPTEQISLISRFGDELQSVVTQRFDRVEKTLDAMQEFLDFQKPIYRIDVYVVLETSVADVDLSGEHLIIEIDGLTDLSGKYSMALYWEGQYTDPDLGFLTNCTSWLNSRKQIGPRRTWSRSSSCFASLSELSITTGGHRVRIADLTSLTMSVFSTVGVAEKILRVLVEINGFTLFDVYRSKSGLRFTSPLHPSLPVLVDPENLVPFCSPVNINLLFEKIPRSQIYSRVVRKIRR